MSQDNSNNQLQIPLYKQLLSNSYGFGIEKVNKLLSRCELHPYLIDISNNSSHSTLSQLIKKCSHSKYSYSFKVISDIALLDLVFCYKGWRHFRGLPLNGQRTWTNGNTASTKINLLKRLKLKVARNVYGNFNDIALNTAYAAEQYNALWYRQWYKEWDDSRVRRLSFIRKTKSVCIMDLNATAQGKISGSNRAAKPGKKKRIYKKNSFTIGFAIGATKWLLAESQASQNNGQIALKTGQLLQVIIAAQVEKKKVQKKVSSIKKKKYNI